MKYGKYLLSLCACIFAVGTMACTSVIVSGKRTASGRPVMMKNRDTGCLENDVRRFVGDKYNFIGLCNSPSEGGEVWTGVNDAGFAVMNTASYNFKDDTISLSRMDMEGVIMYEALGVCRTVDDFERFLEQHAKPLLVEANFGVIDAEGGAAYFEVNNFRWVRYNVDDEPGQYKVVTNFCFAGREEDREGWERYLTASAVMDELDKANAGKPLPVDHCWLMEHFSRSYRHELMGLAEDFCTPSGVAVDQDFIPRNSTSASIIVEGVKAGESPLHTVMWTLIGYPACAVTVPLLVGTDDCLPEGVRPDGTSCAYAQKAAEIKQRHIFNRTISNGKRYFNIGMVQRGMDGYPSLKACAAKVEQTINGAFGPLFDRWCNGAVSDTEFFTHYRRQTDTYMHAYERAFAPYLRKGN